MYRDLTKGNITKTLLVFSLPMIAGNLLQQFYNIADTLIVGKFLGRDALAGGRIGLHAYDISDLDPFRNVNGSGSLIRHLSGTGQPGTAAGRHCSGIRPDFSADGNFVHSGLSVA